MKNSLKSLLSEENIQVLVAHDMSVIKGGGGKGKGGSKGKGSKGKGGSKGNGGGWGNCRPCC